jgi:hypothetical protein
MPACTERTERHAPGHHPSGDLGSSSRLSRFAPGPMRRRRPAAYGAVMIPRSRPLAGAAALPVVATIRLATACSPGCSSASRPQAGPASGTAGSTSGPADCRFAATCYTPQQLEAADGVQPLLQRGIDGRGQTAVLPELAESQLSPPLVTDLRQDYRAGPGWDPVTGWSSPNAQVLVPPLASDPSHWRSQHRTTIRTEVKRSGRSRTPRRTS